MALEVTVSGDVVIKPVEDRWYSLENPVLVMVSWGNYSLAYEFHPGFLFDGRSGGPLADFVAPNLGTQPEVVCWLLHDANGYADVLTFEETNDLLQAMLVQSGHSRFKAWLVKTAVSISDSWFGKPKPGEREYVNVHPVRKFEISAVCLKK